LKGKQLEPPASQCQIKILLAEDNPHDVRLIRYALQQEQNWLTELVVAEDGEKAIHCLLQQDSSANATIPHLVILDLNLPKRDGTEVLQVIRTTKGLQNLPVLVVSSSPEEITEGIVRQANLEANGYLMKPMNIDEYLSLGAVFRRVLMHAQRALRVNCHDCPDERTEQGTGSRQGNGISTEDNVRSARQGGLAMRQYSGDPVCLVMALSS
jgi:DNA-binding response OmpR family regulator